MINFESVILHNFGSYGHSEVALQDRGFCLVTGKNQYPKDNAASNGAGKSFIWSAICFAFTGETIQGLKSNLKNINAIDDDSYVTLNFSVNTDNYKITRIIAPRSDLKLTKNNIDISGKGIRESEKKLLEEFPDITKNLIASTIIIGQGMPNKFSSFSPSGRKDILERLTKSDFMIEDIKERVTNRLEEICRQQRELEDALLKQQSQQNLQQATLDRLRKQDAALLPPDIDALKITLEHNINAANNELTQITESLNAASNRGTAATQRLNELLNSKSKAEASIREEYEEQMTNLLTAKATLDAEISGLKGELSRLQRITDTCPTCKQKLPGVLKPDTSEITNRLAKAEEERKISISALEVYTAQRDTVLKASQIQFTADLQQNQTIVSEAQQEFQKLQNRYTQLNKQLSADQIALAGLQQTFDEWQRKKQERLQEILNLEQSIKNRESELADLANARELVLARLAVVKKMDSLIKRDFRGFLLTNIIDYIAKQAKDYCEIVFGTRDIELFLDGNNLDITYGRKYFDNLSGGEKQRIDLILQFAIRKMLTVYLNFNSNILVLDEITDFLDKKSCQAILNLIKQELQTVESVFIVSHHAASLDLPIDSNISIVKTIDGISEIIQGV